MRIGRSRVLLPPASAVTHWLRERLQGAPSADQQAHSDAAALAGALSVSRARSGRSRRSSKQKRPSASRAASAKRSRSAPLASCPRLAEDGGVGGKHGHARVPGVGQVAPGPRARRGRSRGADGVTSRARRHLPAAVRRERPQASPRLVEAAPKLPAGQRRPASSIRACGPAVPCDRRPRRTGAAGRSLRASHARAPAGPEGPARRAPVGRAPPAPGAPPSRRASRAARREDVVLLQPRSAGDDEQ